MRDLLSIFEWVGIVAGVFVLTILIPGYLASRLARIKFSPKDIELMVVYSTGIALVSVPIALYWVNFFGVPINMFGVAVVLLILFALPFLGQLGSIWRRRKRISS